MPEPFRRTSAALCAAAVLAMAAASLHAATTDDLIFIHHSCGENWLNDGLQAALGAKGYLDEVNEVYYGHAVPHDTGRPASLGGTAGDQTDMNHWIRWFNDYLGHLKTWQAADGLNRIVMFKSCYPISNVVADGPEPGDPFDSTQTLTNYKAVYRHPDGPGNTYADGGCTYQPLEDVFAANPDTLFIPVTAPPRHYAPWDPTDDAEAHRARLFNTWLTDEWMPAYRAATGLDNVAVFDWFHVLAYADDDPAHPNRLRTEYGGDGGDSHPNWTANQDSTDRFASDRANFVDWAWNDFLYVAGDTEGDGDVDAVDLATLGLNWDPSADNKIWAEGDSDGNGAVDAIDLARLGLNWNPAGTGAASAPEPAALALLAAGCLALARRRP